MTSERRKQLPRRRRPHRLPREWYQWPEQPVFVTVCARGGICLSEGHIAPRIVGAMGRLGAVCKVRVHAYCIMPDHMHVVVSVAHDGGDLAKWIRYVKRQTARVLGLPALWQRSYWDRHARRDQDVAAAVDYLLYNPVRRQLCEEPCDWPYSWSEWDPEARGPDPNVTQAMME